jgi:hypothetical protein
MLEERLVFSGLLGGPFNTGSWSIGSPAVILLSAAFAESCHLFWLHSPHTGDFRRGSINTPPANQRQGRQR